MKRSISIIGGILLAASMSSPVFAAGHKHGGGGGESQAGGLPGLEDRVELDEGENNWAVVKANGTTVRSFPPGLADAEHTITGKYDVIFTKDVSGCAYEATIGETGTATPTPGFITVAGGDSSDEVFVQTFSTAGILTDLPFHLYVSCPGHTGD